jgi:hypothetical protein
VSGGILNRQNLFGTTEIAFDAAFAVASLLIARLIPGTAVLFVFVCFALFYLLFGIRGLLFLMHSQRLAAFEQRHAAIRSLARSPWQFNPFGAAESTLRWRTALSQVLIGLVTLFVIAFVIVHG